jgi:hypothetical protein
MKLALYAIATFTTLAALFPIAAQTRPDPRPERALLIGSWAQSGGPGGWVIEETPAGLRIVQTEGSATVASFECPPYGQDCDVKVSGHKAKVSLYYNGAALVEIETIGNDTIKRHFAVQPSGHSMNVQVTHMEGRVQTEETEFERKP